MVSLWPWKGEDNSPASFEKTLSTLSAKIAQSTSRLDQQRQTSRRFKALWTLYSTFAYLFYSIVLALVMEWHNWGIKEYAALAGGPVLIYAVRAIASRFFEYRISHVQHRLEDFQKQRDKTIEKLKVATKYNSTQQLLEKYGGESPKLGPSPKRDGEKRKPPKTSQQQPVSRTGLPPPPTANIPRAPPMENSPSSGPAPHTPSPPPAAGPGPSQSSAVVPPTAPSPIPRPPDIDEPGFAPNASPSSGEYIAQPHWYDRLLDVLLGEDETQPRNRMAMICSTCRLVNGQAPPGIKTPEELGRWRCGSCDAWNGVESETTQILSSLRSEIQPVEREDLHAEPTNETDLAATSEDDQTGAHDSNADVQETEPLHAAEEPKSEPVRRSTRRQGKSNE